MPYGHFVSAIGDVVNCVVAVLGEGVVVAVESFDNSNDVSVEVDPGVGVAIILDVGVIEVKSVTFVR